jgi:hypothetical protein
MMVSDVVAGRALGAAYLTGYRSDAEPMSDLVKPSV